MNAQTGFQLNPARGRSEMSTPARLRNIGSVIISVWVLAVCLALVCVRGIAQQTTQLTPPATQPRTLGNLEVLTDTQGVDFRPYMKNVLDAVRRNWYVLIPEEARAPLMKRGTVVIEFAILPDGKVAEVKLAASSDDTLLDQAAWGGITASAPFAPLPEEFHGQYLKLRFRFFYNPEKSDLPQASSAEAH